MRYRVHFELRPTGPFGLPDEDKVVVPVASKPEAKRSLYSPTLVPTAMGGIVVERGTLSKYRSPSNAVKASEKYKIEPYGLVTTSITDNYLTFSFSYEGESFSLSPFEAITQGIISNLSILSGQRYTAEYLTTTTEQGADVRPIKKLNKALQWSFTVYNLKEQKKFVKDALDAVTYTDKVLLKAYQYHEHAMFLLENIVFVEELRKRSDVFNAVSAFLNFQKSVSTIIGDASHDKDHQKRYRKYGISKAYFDNTLEPLRKIRNNGDVAHYSLESQSIDKVFENLYVARDASLEVLRKYKAFLQNN